MQFFKTCLQQTRLWVHQGVSVSAQPKVFLIVSSDMILFYETSKSTSKNQAGKLTDNSFKPIFQDEK